jgi:hypothetical protein
MPEPVVERDACAQRQEALGDASTQVVEGAGAVAKMPATASDIDPTRVG